MTWDLGFYSFPPVRPASSLKELGVTPAYDSDGLGLTTGGACGEQQGLWIYLLMFCSL